MTEFVFSGANVAANVNGWGEWVAEPSVRGGDMAAKVAKRSGDTRRAGHWVRGGNFHLA